MTTFQKGLDCAAVIQPSTKLMRAFTSSHVDIYMELFRNGTKL